MRIQGLHHWLELTIGRNLSTPFLRPADSRYLRMQSVIKGVNRVDITARYQSDTDPLLELVPCMLKLLIERKPSNNPN